MVAVVDKSLEIAGSGNIPHSSIGPCRVLQVDNPENQHASMIEAVENQSPDVIVVDEITNKRQAEAARTISQRGVAIVATVHGAGLPSIINDPERRELVGGVTSGVLLSDSAARERADKKKAVEKRRCVLHRTSSVVRGSALCWNQAAASASLHLWSPLCYLFPISGAIQPSTWRLRSADSMIGSSMRI